MVRAPTVDKNGLKKGAWSEEEDNKLRAYVLRYGHWNWRQLPRFAGLSRCGKSCRLRWMNYLKAGIRRGNFSQDEDERILKLHQDLGNKWSAIAAKLPGRSDNEIKNHWHTHLKKQRVHNKQDCPSNSAVTILESNNKQVNETVESGPSDEVDHQSSASCSAEVSSLSTTLTSSQSFEEPSESFWNELLFSDGIYYCGNNANTYSSSESVMSSNSSTVEEDFTLPFSLFCDDINFFNNFMQ